MAILKDVGNEFGIDFHYHKLREVRVTNDDKGVQLVLTIYSWADKQARIDGKQPCLRQCIIDGADFAMTPFYALLKAKFDEFNGGENDFDNSFKGGDKAPHPVFYDQTAQGKLFKTWSEQPLEKPDDVPHIKITEPVEEVTEVEPEEAEVMDMTKPQDEIEESEDLPEENYGEDEEENTEGDKE